MITDERLKKAVEEAENALVKSLENDFYCEHEFSDEFLFKMNELINGVKPQRKKNSVLKSIASVLIILLITGSVLLFSETELGASCSSWIKTQYDKIMSYHIAEVKEENSEDIVVYEPRWIPEGYKESSRIKGDDIRIILFADSAGNVIRFMYTKKGSITIEQDDFEYVERKVRDCYAELYISEDDSDSNKLVWIDEEDMVMFCISGFLEEDEIIKMATRVSKTMEKEE